MPTLSHAFHESSDRTVSGVFTAFWFGHAIPLLMQCVVAHLATLVSLGPSMLSVCSSRLRKAARATMKSACCFDRIP